MPEPVGGDGELHRDVGLTIGAVALELRTDQRGPIPPLPTTARLVGYDGHRFAQLEFGGAVGLVVEVGLIGGPTAMERVEVEAWGPGVVQRVGIVLTLEARDRAEGDVVVDELAEVGVAGGRRIANPDDGDYRVITAATRWASDGRDLTRLAARMQEALDPR